MKLKIINYTCPKCGTKGVSMNIERTSCPHCGASFVVKEKT
jgi:DNA-directed RNA polymerase subunit RPC12/RpoP